MGHDAKAEQERDGRQGSEGVSGPRYEEIRGKHRDHAEEAPPDDREGERGNGRGTMATEQPAVATPAAQTGASASGVVRRCNWVALMPHAYVLVNGFIRV